MAATSMTMKVGVLTKLTGTWLIKSTANDFEIDTDFLKCKDFLIGDINTAGRRHILFATPFQLTLLKQATRWFIDGTFKVVGHPFKSNGQLVTINAIVQNSQFPVAFALMSRRRKTDYVEVLELIKEKIGEVQVEGFVLYFESGAWQAIRTVFPGIEIKGCMFHWTQAVFRHVQQLGLAPLYSKRQGAHLFIRQLLALPCLPSSHIRETLDTLAGRVNTPQMERLVDYKENQWMNNTVFEISSWSVFGNSVRTNNDVEGWHRRLNSRVGARVGFYKLVPLLRKEAEIVEMKVKSNDLDMATSKKTKKLNEKLQELWDKYSSGDVTTTQLLKKCAELFAPKKEDV